MSKKYRIGRMRRADEIKAIPKYDKHVTYKDWKRVPPEYESTAYSSVLSVRNSFKQNLRICIKGKRKGTDIDLSLYIWKVTFAFLLDILLHKKIRT
jgi:hypothetical protein